MTAINPRSAVQPVNIDDDALKFQVPFVMSVSGPSQSGHLLTPIYLFKEVKTLLV